MYDMYDMITGFFRHYAGLESDFVTILVVMVGWAALLLHLALDSRWTTALFTPVMFVGGLVAFAVAREGYLNMFSIREMQAVAVSVIGILAGFLFALGAIQVVHWIKEWRRALTLDDRV